MSKYGFRLDSDASMAGMAIGVTITLTRKVERCAASRELWKKGFRKLVDGDDPTVIGQLREGEDAYLWVTHGEVSFLVSMQSASPEYQADASKYSIGGYFAVTDDVIANLK